MILNENQECFSPINTAKLTDHSLPSSLCRWYDLTGQGGIPILHKIHWEIAMQQLEVLCSPDICISKNSYY